MTALVCILHDIHLLGDLTPDNSRIQTIPKYAEIVHDIKTKLVNLMDDDASRERMAESLEGLLGESVEIAGREGTQRATEHMLRGMCEARMLSGTLAYRG